MARVDAIREASIKEQTYLALEVRWHELGAAAFQMRSWAAFVPAAADFGLKLTGFGPFFSYGQSTGLTLDDALGNPTADLVLNKVGGGLQGVLSSAIQDDRELSQADIRKLYGALVFHNMVGVQNLFEMLNQGSGLPEFDK